MSGRERKIQDMQALVDKYMGVPVDAEEGTESKSEGIWDTIKRTKSNLVDKPLENLSIQQKSKARQWKKYQDELKTILNE